MNSIRSIAPCLLAFLIAVVLTGCGPSREEMRLSLELAAAKQKVDSLNDTLDSARKGNESTNKTLDEVRAASSKKDFEIARLQAALEDLERSKSSLAEKVTLLTGQLESAKAEIANAASQRIATDKADSAKPLMAIVAQIAKIAAEIEGGLPPEKIKSGHAELKASIKVAQLGKSLQEEELQRIQLASDRVNGVLEVLEAQVMWDNMLNKTRLGTQDSLYYMTNKYNLVESEGIGSEAKLIAKWKLPDSLRAQYNRISRPNFIKWMLEQLSTDVEALNKFVDAKKL